MSNRVIALSTHRRAPEVPEDTILALRDQNLEGNVLLSNADQGRTRSVTLTLTNRSADKLRNEGHTGKWRLHGQYGRFILVRPEAPEKQDPQGPHSPAFPEVPGTSMQRPLWTTFIKDEILDYYDGPKALLKRDRNGQDYLVLWNDQDHRTYRWLHIPLSPETVRQVLTGEITLLEAFNDSDFVFFVDEATDDGLTKSVMAVPALIPAHHPIRATLPLPQAAMSCKAKVVETWYASTNT